MSSAIGNLAPILAYLITIFIHIVAQTSSKIDTDSDYPVAVSSPTKTNFSCKGRPAGYYADISSDCQIYHMCDEAGRLFTNTCPERTRFQQRTTVCDHWYMVECSESEMEYKAPSQQATATATATATASGASLQGRYEWRKTHRHSQRVIAKFPYQRNKESSRESSEIPTDKVKLGGVTSTDPPPSASNQIYTSTSTAPPSPSKRSSESALAPQTQQTSSGNQEQFQQSQSPLSPPSIQQQPPLSQTQPSDSPLLASDFSSRAEGSGPQQSHRQTSVNQQFPSQQSQLQQSQLQQSVSQFLSQQSQSLQSQQFQTQQSLPRQPLFPSSQPQLQPSSRPQLSQPQQQQQLLSTSKPQLQPPSRQSPQQSQFQPILPSSQPQFRPSIPSSQSQFQPSSPSQTPQPKLLYPSSSLQTSGFPTSQSQSTQPRSTFFPTPSPLSHQPSAQSTFAPSTQTSSSTESPRRQAENVYLVSNSSPSRSSVPEPQSGFRGIAFNNPGGSISQVRYVTPYREAKIERVLIPPRTTQPQSTPASVPSSQNQYTNNPYFESYFKTSFAISTPTSPRTVAISNYTRSPEDEKAIEENRIEIVITDPRKMFYIPDSDNDPADLSEGHSRVLFIDIPVKGNENIQEVSELDTLNKKCPQCHPSYLLPGSCSPCVLIT